MEKLQKTLKNSFDKANTALNRGDVLTVDGLESVFFDEDYGFGEIVIINTRVDENVICVIKPEDFVKSNKAYDLINEFTEKLSKLEKWK